MRACCTLHRKFLITSIKVKRKFKGYFLLILFIFSALAVSAQNGMTIADAMQLAESNSPSVKKSRLNLVRSSEILKAQKAALKSNFSLLVNPLSYNQNREFNDLISKWNSTKTTESFGALTISQPILFTDAKISLVNSFGYTNSYSEYSGITTKGFSNRLALILDQPLFTYNRAKLTFKELELSLEDAQLNYAVQRLSLEKEVAQSFYYVYQLQMSLEIAESAYKNMQQGYEMSRKKSDAGISPKEELFQAELNLASSKSDLENKRVLLENAKDQFKLLIGMSLYENFIVLPSISVDTVNVDISFAIDQGLTNRIELRQRAIAVETSEFDLIQTKATNEFKGDLGLSVGLFGENNKAKDVFNNRNDNESVSLSFTLPLWDWGERKSRIKASEASIASEKISLEEEQNEIILGIRMVYRNMLNLWLQIDIARQNVKNAQMTYALNLEKYKNGNLSGMELNIYQNQLSEKQLSFTNSLISYKLELLNLKIQTLYDFENKKAVALMTPSE
jgi:outer membrane protein